MKIQDIFNLALKVGIESDFRGADGVQKLLDGKKKILVAEELNPYIEKEIKRIAKDANYKLEIFVKKPTCSYQKSFIVHVGLPRFTTLRQGS